MPHVFNLDELRFEKRNASVPDFVWHSSPRLARLAGSKLLQIDVRSLDSDRFSFPYHFHRASEEFFLVLSGESTLRTPQGFRGLTKGDLAFFEEGASGAHQLYNHSDAPCVYLDVRATPAIDVVEYPDSGKINVMPQNEIFEAAAKVEYYKGEESVRERWPKDVLRTSPRSD